LYFPYDENARSIADLVGLVAIFLFLEGIADMIFVWVIWTRFLLPILQLPKERFFSKHTAMSVTSLSLICVVVGLCIGMAAETEV
jgi:hypothetical protein